MTDLLLVDSYYNDVNDWLSVGGDLDLAYDVTSHSYDETIAELRGHGVTHVLDLRSEWDNAETWEAAGLPAENYGLFPIIDSRRYEPPESWFEGVEKFAAEFWVNSCEGDRLYVHCHMGINRAPSAAMMLLMFIEGMHPWEAFLTVRDARPVAGLVYAEAVGIRGIAIAHESADDDAEFAAITDFQRRLSEYWTAEAVGSVNQGIAFYRSAEGGTIKVGGQTVLACPVDPEGHNVGFKGGDATCRDCGALAVNVANGLTALNPS